MEFGIYYLVSLKEETNLDVADSH